MNSEEQARSWLLNRLYRAQSPRTLDALAAQYQAEQQATQMCTTSAYVHRQEPWRTSSTACAARPEQSFDHVERKTFEPPQQPKWRFDSPLQSASGICWVAAFVALIAAGVAMLV